MSTKKLAIVAAAAVNNHGGLNHTEMSSAPGSPPPPIYGVNVMLGGAMLSGIILVVFIMCYCCHKNARKQESHLPAYWRDSGLPLHVYTVEGHQQCFESEDFSLSDIQTPATPGPPPAYDVVVPVHKATITSVSPARILPEAHDYPQRGDANDEQDVRLNTPCHDDSGLPSYEAALRLGVSRHV